MPATALNASVVVPTHRGAHRLRGLLPALAAQDRTDWEAVFVVDGELDDTPELLAAWRNRLRMRVLINPQPQGVAAALTRGFNAATGSYLIRCDDDLQMPATFVSDHLAAHAGQRRLAVISLTRDQFRPGRYARAYGKPANRRALQAALALPPEQRWLAWAACNSLPRSAWEDSGGFDPRFAYGEDFEFGYRLWRQGLSFVIPENLIVEHTGPATCAATRLPRAFISGAARQLFERIHPEAAPPTSPTLGLRARLWNLLGDALAYLLRAPAACRRLGRLLDFLLPAFPAKVAGKLVALGVESAGKAGRCWGKPDLHRYRAQKDAELQAELSQDMD